MLHERLAGQAARAATPLEIVSVDPGTLRKSALVLFSASGRNADILAAARAALRAEPPVVIVVTVGPGTPLGHELRDQPFAELVELDLTTNGDGFLATFDGPTRAILCAHEIRDRVQRLGIEVRIGLHTGECELMGNDVGGLAVNTASRVVGEAGPGEILVSNTVKDLVAGSGLTFTDRGFHNLKGLEGEWRLFAVE